MIIAEMKTQFMGQLSFICSIREQYAGSEYGAIKAMVKVQMTKHLRFNPTSDLFKERCDKAFALATARFEGMRADAGEKIRWLKHKASLLSPENLEDFKKLIINQEGAH
jgi:hypothetical protein